MERKIRKRNVKEYIIKILYAQPSPAFMKGFEKRIKIFAPKNYDMHEQNWRIVCLKMTLTIEINVKKMLL